MNQNEQYSKSEERFYHEDEYNRDFEYGLSRKSSYEGSNNEELVAKSIYLGRRNKKFASKNGSNIKQNISQIIKLGAITVTTISAIAITSTVHEHKPSDEWVLTKPATCISYGKEEMHCSECEKVIDARILPYSEHGEKEWVVTIEPNCSYTGVESLMCKTCLEVLDQRNTGLNGHIAGEWTVVKEGTCLEDGLEIVKCTICDEEIESKIIVADHEEVIDEGLVATCTKTGLTEGSHCGVCQETLVASKHRPFAWSCPTRLLPRSWVEFYPFYPLSREPCLLFCG